MLGMIILCLEKVNILFNQPDREWVAISMHFLETGIQGVRAEITFCFFLGLLVSSPGRDLCPGPRGNGAGYVPGASLQGMPPESAWLHLAPGL